jgi:hypothetical protein
MYAPGNSQKEENDFFGFGLHLFIKQKNFVNVCHLKDTHGHNINQTDETFYLKSCHYSVPAC